MRFEAPPPCGSIGVYLFPEVVLVGMDKLDESDLFRVSGWTCMYVFKVGGRTEGRKVKQK